MGEYFLRYINLLLHEYERKGYEPARIVMSPLSYLYLQTGEFPDSGNPPLPADGFKGALWGFPLYVADVFGVHIVPTFTPWKWVEPVDDFLVIPSDRGVLLEQLREELT